MKPFKITQSITNKDDISIKNYFRDISKIPLLTKEEELELGYIIQNNLKKLNNSENLSLQEKRLTEIEINKAVNKLVSANLKFVISVAKQYCNQGLPFIDLVNEGNLGMIQAAKKFDPNKGYKFISYAVWWIRQFIMQAIALKSRTIKTPVNQSASLSKLNNAVNKFEQLNGIKPSYEELSKLTGISVEKINKIYSYNSSCISVDTPFTTEEDSGCLLDVVRNPNCEDSDKNLMDSSLKQDINRVLDKLSPREKVILQMFFGIDCDAMQLDQIAPKFGVTSERIRQIKDKAIEQIIVKYKSILKTYII